MTDRIANDICQDSRNVRVAEQIRPCEHGIAGREGLVRQRFGSHGRDVAGINERELPVPCVVAPRSSA